MGGELLTLDAIPQKLAQGLAPDLSHARSRGPVSHTAVNQVQGPPRRAAAAEQSHRHLQHRSVALVPAGFRDGVAVLEFLLPEALSCALPVTNHLWSLAASLVSSSAKIQALIHQFIDATDTDIGITNVVIAPLKR